MRVRANNASGGGGGDVELEFGSKTLSAREAPSVTTTKKARGFVMYFNSSGYLCHYYVLASAPTELYYGQNNANAIHPDCPSFHATFTDNSISFNDYISSSSLTIYYVIIY